MLGELGYIILKSITKAKDDFHNAFQLFGELQNCTSYPLHSSEKGNTDHVCDRAIEKFGSVMPEIVIILLSLQLQRLLIQLGSPTFLK